MLDVHFVNTLPVDTTLWWVASFSRKRESRRRVPWGLDTRVRGYDVRLSMTLAPNLRNGHLVSSTTSYVFRIRLTLAVSRRAMYGLPHGYKLPLARSAPVLCSASSFQLMVSFSQEDDRCSGHVQYVCYQVARDLNDSSSLSVPTKSIACCWNPALENAP